MTVRELREALSAFPDDMEVHVNAGVNELGNGEPLATVNRLTLHQLFKGGTWWIDFDGDRNPDYSYRDVVNLCS